MTTLPTADAHFAADDPLFTASRQRNAGGGVVRVAAHDGDRSRDRRGGHYGRFELHHDLFRLARTDRRKPAATQEAVRRVGGCRRHVDLQRLRLAAIDDVEFPGRRSSYLEGTKVPTLRGKH